MPSRPARTLTDFAPLLPAETALLHAAATGGIAKIGFQRPRSAAPVLRMRAEFLAWLACGADPDAATRVAGRRLQVVGACIVGVLDLRDALVPVSLWLYRCVFLSAPLLGGACFRDSLSFPDSGLPGLQAEGCRIDGELALNAGCSLYGELNLTRVAIGLDLNAERLRLQPSAKFGYARPCRLLAEGLRVGGSVRLGGGVEASGEMNFRGARIGGDFIAGSARLNADLEPGGARGLALNLSRASVEGDVLLNAGFSAAGRVDLQRVHIGGDLDCDGADFDAVGDAGWGHAVALRLDRARIGGALALHRLQRPLQGASLVDARVATLADDTLTWGQHHQLDGLHYRRFGPEAPRDAGMRIGWLLRQHASALGSGFLPDPWVRAGKVLRRMGHGRAAGSVAIGREHHLRGAGRIGEDAPALLRGPIRLLHATFGLLTGHGHRPLRLLGALAVTWLGCGALYWAATGGASGIASVPAFHPFAFSLDALLPGLDLGQVRLGLPALRPGPDAPMTASGLRALAMAEAVAGWLALLAAAVCVSGITERDRQG